MSAESFVASGYLDLKVPPGSPDRKLWKAWQYCWVVARIDILSSLKPTLELRLSQHKGDHRHQLLKIPSDGLRMFRGRSRSRPLRTWGLALREKVILYLAAEAEAVAQLWMERLRDALWPPLLVSQIRLVTSSPYRVSLLDDEKTFRTGLLGAYGHLIAKDNELTLVHPNSGNNLLTCQIDDIRKVQIAREVKSKNKGCGVLRICIGSVHEEKNYYFYSQKAVEIMNWISQLCGKDQHRYNYVPKNSQKVYTSHYGNIKDTEVTDTNFEHLQTYDVPTRNQLQDPRVKLNSNSETSYASVLKSPEVKSNTCDITVLSVGNQGPDSEIYDVPRHSLTATFPTQNCCLNNTKEESPIAPTALSSNSSNVAIDKVNWEAFEIYDVPQPSPRQVTNNLNKCNRDAYASIQKTSKTNCDTSKTVDSDKNLALRKVCDGSDAFFNVFETHDVPQIGLSIEPSELATEVNTQVETVCATTKKEDTDLGTTSSTDFDLGDELDDDFYETINFENRRWSIDSHIYSEIAPVRGSVGAQTIYEEIDDEDGNDNVAPPLPRRRIIYSEDSWETPLEVRPRTSSALRLQMLSESVNETLRQMQISET